VGAFEESMAKSARKRYFERGIAIPRGGRRARSARACAPDRAERLAIEIRFSSLRSSGMLVICAGSKAWTVSGPGGPPHTSMSKAVKIACRGGRLPGQSRRCARAISPATPT